VQREAVHSNLTVTNHILSISLKYKQPPMIPIFKGELYTSILKTNLSRKKSTYKTMNVLNFKLSHNFYADEIATMSQWFDDFVQKLKCLEEFNTKYTSVFKFFKAPPKREIFGHFSYLSTWFIVFTHSIKIIRCENSDPYFIGIRDQMNVFLPQIMAAMCENLGYERGKSLQTIFKACTLQLLCYKNTPDYH